MKAKTCRGSATIAFLVIAPLSAALFAQAPKPVTIEWCQEATRQNQPLLSKLSLVDRGERLSLGTANTAWLPRVTLSGKYTDQSDVTQLALDLPIPGFSIPENDTEQYQIAAEVSQTIWDGGLTAAKKRAIKAGAQADRARVETNLYALRSQVNALFFGVLIVEGQLEQNAILLDELATNEKRVAAWVANGIATAPDLDAVRVEALNAAQTRITLEAARRSLLESLSLLTGEELTDADGFAHPEQPATDSPPAVGSATSAGSATIPKTDAHAAGRARPETALFAALAVATGTQKSQLVAQAMPRVSAFVQGGYGKPALDMFDPDPATFWIAGVRFSWAIDGFWSLPFTLAKVDSDMSSIAADSDSFNLSVEMEAARHQSEIARLAALVETDGELVALRARIKEAARTRLDNGTIGTVDFLREINAEALARQSRSLHEIQLLEAQFALMNTINQ